MYKLLKLTFIENNYIDFINCYDLKALQICSDYMLLHPECKLISMQIEQRGCNSQKSDRVSDKNTTPFK